MTLNDHRRDFKGIWISKDVWLSEELTLIEKIFYVEIDSLDNDQGCFASNGYFSKFFSISAGRCSQVIKSLEAKGFVKVRLEYSGKQVVKRVIRVVNKLNTLPAKTKYPYLENAQDNNINNDTTEDLHDRIDELETELENQRENFNRTVTMYEKRNTLRKAEISVVNEKQKHKRK